MFELSSFKFFRLNSQDERKSQKTFRTAFFEG